MQAQGRMLANLIKYIITNLSAGDEPMLKHSLEHLARVHNARGITAEQYSVMGMVLVHTVRICTGPAFWTDEHRNAWVQIYSKMMSYIIPVVISGRMPDSGTCPALAQAQSVESEQTPSSAEELSHTLREHFRENAENHISQLEVEAKTKQAEEEEHKYLILSRVITIARKVETHIREVGNGGGVGSDGRPVPKDGVTGHRLLHLLLSNGWVSDLASAQTAAACFLTFNLMSRHTDQEPNSPRSPQSRRASIQTQQPPAPAAAASPPPTSDKPIPSTLPFPDDATVYCFNKVSCYVSVSPGDSSTTSRSGPSPAPHLRRATSDSFQPQCFTNDIHPKNLMHALDQTSSIRPETPSAGTTISTGSVGGRPRHQAKPSYLSLLNTDLDDINAAVDRENHDPSPAVSPALPVPAPASVVPVSPVLSPATGSPSKRIRIHLGTTAQTAPELLVLIDQLQVPRSTPATPSYTFLPSPR